MHSRRSFLLGLGGLVTSTFVARAKTHSVATRGPLLLDPGRAEETLYLYDTFGEGSFEPRPLKWRVSLGPDRWPAPPPPSWHEFLGRSGYDLSREGDVERALSVWGLQPEHLLRPMDGYAWETMWECSESPQAKAFVLLQELKLDVELNGSGEKAGCIVFTDGGGHPGSNERWVDLRDDLTASLLQAKVIERRLRIAVEIGRL